MATSHVSDFDPGSGTNSDSDSDPNAPLQTPGTNSVALSVADRAGTTVAIYKRNVGDVHWRTIGTNLIAYWILDGGSVPLILDEVARMFPATDCVSLLQLLEIKPRLIHLLQGIGWSHNLSNIYIRDFLKAYGDPYNILKIIVVGPFVRIEVKTETSSATGTGAQAALKVVNKYADLLSCNLLADNKNLHEHIVYKAIVEAVPTKKKVQVDIDKQFLPGCCEIVRGSVDEGWKSLRTIAIDELVASYGTRMHHKPGQEGLPRHSQVYSTRDRHPGAKNSTSGLVIIRKVQYA